MLLEGSSHLSVDEARHAPAATWQAAISHFPGHRVLLFTAAPHRRDKQGLRGRQIYRYSLAATQEAGHYCEIDALQSCASTMRIGLIHVLRLD